MRIIREPTVTSTNAVALELWREAGQDAPLAVVAEVQTDGVGRDGARWESPRGGLWMTIAWPLRGPITHYRALPLVVGYTVASEVDAQCGLDCSLKWPNDVLVRGRKLAGILCQTQTGLLPSAILIGIGLNGNIPIDELPMGLALAPTSLALEAGHWIDLEALRDSLCGRINENLRLYDKEGLAPFLNAVRQRIAWRDEWVVWSTPQGAGGGAGLLRGLDAEGRLEIEGPDGSPLVLAHADNLRRSSGDHQPGHCLVTPQR